MQLIDSSKTTGPAAKSNGLTKDPKERFKNHKLTPTSLCIDNANRYAFTASKDGSIIKWCLKTNKICAKVYSISKKEFESNKDLKQTRHHKHINCIAISSDNRFLATGGSDKLIRIYSPKDLSWLHTFQKHKDEVTALAFRLNHSLLYSGSADKSVMLWTLEDDDNRVFIDDLYGHESTVTSIDVLGKERVLTSGGRDQSIRIWKIVEQAQTVFETTHQSVDVTRYIDQQTFVSGGEDGSISVWTVMKRKPIFNLINAHPLKKVDEKVDADGRRYRYDEIGLKNWISALATYSLKEVAPAKTTHMGKKKRKLKDGEELVTDGVEDDSDASTDDEDDESSSDEQIQDEEDEDEISTKPSSRPLALVASGSCNNEVKVWKLSKTGSDYALNLHQTFECLGFVNDLRFTSDGKKLLAVCGPEHKFGRWWRIPHVKCYLKVFDVNMTR